MSPIFIYLQPDGLSLPSCSFTLKISHINFPKFPISLPKEIWPKYPPMKFAIRICWKLSLLFLTPLSSPCLPLPGLSSVISCQNLSDSQTPFKKFSSWSVCLCNDHCHRQCVESLSAVHSSLLYFTHFIFHISLLTFALTAKCQRSPEHPNMTRRKCNKLIITKKKNIFRHHGKTTQARCSELQVNGRSTPPPSPLIMSFQWRESKSSLY